MGSSPGDYYRRAHLFSPEAGRRRTDSSSPAQIPDADLIDEAIDEK